MENKIKVFENRQVRTSWNAEEEEWYFSVVDVVAVLTDSVNPTDYLKKMRKRDLDLNAYIGTNCPQVEMRGESGKKRKVLAASTKGVLRIVQSIPSPKAEPFKIWLAQVGSERLDEIADPEKAIMRGILTNEMTKAWSGLSVQEYKELKGLKKENLRDNMTNIELVLNMLAEVTTTAISKQEQPGTFDENKAVARRGGKVAKNARTDIESQLGQSVVSPLNASDKLALEIKAEEDKDGKQ